MKLAKLGRPASITLLALAAGTALLLTLPAGGRAAFIVSAIFALYLAFWITIAIHEFGHLVAGWTAGFRFVLYGAGPLRVRREGERLAVGTADRWLPMGMAVSVPRTLEGLDRGMTRVLAGGPLANLLTGGLALGGVAVLVRGGAPAGYQGVALLGLWLLGFVGLLGVLLGGINLLPVSEEGLMSDGARLRMMRAGGPEARRWSATWALFSAAMAGERPRDWDAALLWRATELEDGTFDEGGAAMLGLERALDRGEIDEAERFLERIRRAAVDVPLLQPLHAAEAAIFLARHRGRPAEAREWLERARGGLLEDHSRLHAEAAVLLAEGRSVEAAEVARRALAAADRAALTPRGSLVAERERMRELLTAAERPPGGPPHVARPAADH